MANDPAVEKQQMNIKTPMGLLGLLLLSSGAMANDDRDLTTPTQHRYASNITEAGIDSLTAEGFRMHDIEVLSTSPYKFAGSFVKNAGMYAIGWWWTADKNAADLTTFYTQRNARMEDVEVYFKNGKKQFAGTFVSNSGRDAKDWSWFDNLTFDQAVQKAEQTGSRITDLDVYTVGNQRRFAGVMIKNVDSDYRNYWVFSNRTKAEVSQLLSQHDARLTDLERISEDRYAGIMEESQGQMWWYQTDRTWEQLQFAVSQCGARVIDIERYEKGGKALFNFILINNSNELESRIGNLLRTNSNGARGFILREVNGATLGGILEDYRIYPASSIKVLEHFYWSNRVGLGFNPANLVPIYSDHTKDTHPANGSTIAAWKSLQSAANNMMINSSNQDTNALQDFAGNGNGVTGRATINAFGTNTLGVTLDLKINHKLGSQGANSPTPNVATMRQFAKIYERFADNSVLNANGRNFFRANILNETSTTGFRNGVWTIIAEEGIALGKSPETRIAFRALVQLCWKGGNWGSTTQYFSGAGWIRLPYQSGATSKEFALGAFVDACTFSNVGMTSTVMPEIMRDEIRKALATWP